MFQNICNDFRYSFGRKICLFAVDIPHVFVVDIGFFVHRFDIIHAERQNVFIVDSVNDSISMQFIAERLLCRAQIRIFRSPCVYGKNRRTRKPEKIIFLEIFRNRLMHVAELRTMTLVENNNDLLIEYGISDILFHERT